VSAAPVVGLGQGDEDTRSAAVVPDYPAGALAVGPLGELLAVGTAAGLPAALVGAAGLGVAAACVMPAVLRVDRERKSWEERPALWVPAVAPPGGGKSPAVALARAPLDALEDAAYDRWPEELAAWESASVAERGPRPVRDRWTVDDITMEQTMCTLAELGGRAAVVVDELRTHLAGMGRYRSGRGDGGDRARWLAMWDGRPQGYERKTGDVRFLRIRRPVVPILGGLQPEFVGMLGEDVDGSRARWLPHISSATVRADPPDDTPRWRAWIEQTAPNRSERLWWLDGAGRARWEDARDRWRELGRAPDTGPAVAGAAGKADRQTLRVALVLAELAAPAAGGPVPTEAIAGAVTLIDYVLGVWAVLGGSAETLATSRREETLIRAADKLAAWIETRGGRVTRRDILRARAASIRTAAQLDQVLAEYRELYPGAVRDENPPSGGTPTTAIYAPRDPRVSLPMRSNPAGVDRVDTRQTEIPNEPQRCVLEQVRAMRDDHNGVDTATVATAVDTDLSTPTPPDPDLDQIISAWRERTGTTLGPAEAAELRDRIVGTRTVDYPTRYAVSAIRSERDPRRLLAPPAPASRPSLPQWCGRCGDGNPAARTNQRFRTDTGEVGGVPCPTCHPAVALVGSA
jgi:hypothetical protein